MKPRFLELFCGTKSMTKAFKEEGFDTLSVDMNWRFLPDIAVNILDWDRSLLPAGFIPDVIWASPPCQGFTIIDVNRNWTKRGKVAVPISERAVLGVILVKKTLEIIKDLHPLYWFIENPRGMLRTQSVVRGLLRNTVTYCQYGEYYQKPTDIWTNCTSWDPKPPCKAGARCHVASQRGWSHMGVMGLKDATERAKIPIALCREIAGASMRGYREQNQDRLRLV